MKEDHEVAKYYKWATENKINNGHIILKIFKTPSDKDTQKIAAKILSKINCNHRTYDSSDINDIMCPMYSGSRY